MQKNFGDIESGKHRTGESIQSRNEINFVTENEIK